YKIIIMKKLIFAFILLGITFSSQSQILSNKEGNYTKADSLRGSLRPERTNFDVLKYDLHVKVDPEEKYISGVNSITLKVLKSAQRLQLDLFENMNVDSIVFQGKQLSYQREFNAVFIDFPLPLDGNKEIKVDFYYSGNPIVAKNAPWDGGFIFTEDENEKPWVSVAVQGTGASLWYPNLDHQSDEPEEAEIHVAAPNGLMNVSNGRFTGKKDLQNGYTEWSWKVSNPINNYNIILNIGDYVHLHDTYQDLDLDYYVLSYNKEKAREQFKEVSPMMDCFYEKFGAYPFVEDSYKLVETPYLGMEHQSAVGYGNGFKNGYLGKDLSGTGVGLKWDFIIIHESAHEWFGNSITAKDIADMWIHEAFTTYAESVYVECRWGKEDALTYLFGLRGSVMNNSEIIGDYGVNTEGSSDMYYKGANMLNTIRGVINDDEKWWALLKEYTENYKHQIIDTPTVINYFEKHTKASLTPIFNQYLNYARLPELQLKKKNNKVYARWETDVEDFAMPLILKVNGKEVRVAPTNQWKKMPFKNSLEKVEVDLKKYYILVTKA
ncbi:MAG: M1 family metallopeptidase, partial [Mesonia sp.]